MTKEMLMEMGLEEEMAERVAAAAAAELEAVRMDAAVERMLLKNHARCLPAVKALLVLEGAKLLEDGSVEGLQAQVDLLRNDEETAFLFEQERLRFAGVELGEGMDELDDGPARMSYAELCAYLEEHPEARL